MPWPQGGEGGDLDLGRGSPEQGGRKPGLSGETPSDRRALWKLGTAGFNWSPTTETTSSQAAHRERCFPLDITYSRSGRKVPFLSELWLRGREIARGFSGAGSAVSVATSDLRSSGCRIPLQECIVWGGAVLENSLLRRNAIYCNLNVRR